MVRSYERLARELVQRRGQPFGEPPAVDEDQRRAVRPNQREQARVNAAPDRGANGSLRGRPARNRDWLRQARHIFDGNLDLQLHRLGLARVDDSDRPPARRRSTDRELVVQFTRGRPLRTGLVD